MLVLFFTASAVEEGERGAHSWIVPLARDQLHDPHDYNPGDREECRNRLSSSSSSFYFSSCFTRILSHKGDHRIIAEQARRNFGGWTEAYQGEIVVLVVIFTAAAVRWSSA